jgi:GxxExxY protein
MPIIHKIDLRPMTQGAFSRIDYEVMGAAFTAHNELGRLFDEKNYADHMAKSLSRLNHQIEREYRIRLTHGDYSKDYSIDLLVDSSIAYELKAVEGLNTKHEAQALNYLYLCNLSHGKLINFGKPSVESRFISTSLTHAERLSFTIDESNWSETSQNSLKDTLKALLDDWGTHLSLEAYKEALIHFCCSSRLSEEALPFRTGSGYQGVVKLNRITEDSFLYLTTTGKYLNDHENHLRKVLDATRQRQAQWILFDRNRVTLRTLSTDR